MSLNSDSDLPLSVSAFLEKKKMDHVIAGQLLTLSVLQIIIYGQQTLSNCPREQDGALCGTDLQSWGLA